jgi:hypothetical protein
MPEILFIHIVCASFALVGAYAALFAPQRLMLAYLVISAVATLETVR